MPIRKPNDTRRNDRSSRFARRTEAGLARRRISASIAIRSVRSRPLAAIIPSARLIPVSSTWRIASRLVAWYAPSRRIALPDLNALLNRSTAMSRSPTTAQFDGPLTIMSLAMLPSETQYFTCRCSNTTGNIIRASSHPRLKNTEKIQRSRGPAIRAIVHCLQAHNSGHEAIFDSLKQRSDGFSGLRLKNRHCCFRQRPSSSKV